MPSQAVERFTDNVWVKLLSRASMLLTASLLGLIVYFGTGWINGIKSDIAQIKEDIEPLAVLETRLSAVENTATAARTASEQNDKRLASLEARQNYDDTRIDKLQEAITRLAETVSALTSTVKVIYDDRQRSPPTR